MGVKLGSPTKTLIDKLGERGFEILNEHEGDLPQEHEYYLEGGYFAEYNASIRIVESRGKIHLVSAHINCYNDKSTALDIFNDVKKKVKSKYPRYTANKDQEELFSIYQDFEDGTQNQLVINISDSFGTYTVVIVYIAELFSRGGIDDL